MASAPCTVLISAHDGISDLVTVGDHGANHSHRE